MDRNRLIENLKELCLEDPRYGMLDRMVDEDKAEGAGSDSSGPPPPEAVGPFDGTQIAEEVAEARVKSRDMVRGILGMFGPFGEVTEAHFPFLGFIERAQAFSLGAIAMIESGNPLAAATLLRSFAENLASVFYVNAHPTEMDKLRPGARQGVKVGRIISQAEKHLPGFKSMYDQLSSMAHPSGAGSYQTLKVADDKTFTWQSYPRFRDVEGARYFLTLLDDLTALSAEVIKNTAKRFESGDSR